MSGPRSDDYVVKGAQGSSASNPAQSQSYLTGRNLQDTSNGWNTPFFESFVSQYQKAMDDGTATNYFLDRRDGIAQVDQTGLDSKGQTQTVRAGDVFNKGKHVGNVYDQYGKEQADQMLAPFMLSSDEQMHGVTIDQKRAETTQNMAAAQSRSEYDAKVAQKKAADGNAEDLWAPAAGAAGGAAMGAGAGAVLGSVVPVIGTAIGAVAGGVLGGAIGGVGAYLNRDELEDQAARGQVQAEMLDAEGAGGAAFAKRVENAANLFGEISNPFKQAVHGAADVVLGQQGDDVSGFYATDPLTGESKRDAAWTAADVAAGVAGGALQFASPEGALAYQAQMGASILGKTGTMALTGGKTFDDRTGAYDNVFTDRQGRFDAGSAAAGIGDIGIDVLQLGMGRALTGVAGAMGKNPGMLGKIAGMATARTAERAELAGYRFTLNAEGEATKAGLSMTVMAPSEFVQHMGVKASAMLAKGGRAGNIGPDDLYRAAQNMANGGSVRKAALLSAFGEGGEEAVQAMLEPTSHNEGFSWNDVASAGVMGAAMGAGMTLGSRIGTQSHSARQMAQANLFHEAMGLAPMTKEQWKALPEAERQAKLAVPPEVAKAMAAAAKQVQQQGLHDFAAGNVGVERLTDWQHAQLAAERNSLNEMIDGTYVISKAQHNVDDHMVVSSINTTVDLLTRNEQGLAEQVTSATTPEATAALTQAHDASVALVRRATEIRDAFYDPTTTPAEQELLVNKLNAELAQMYELPNGHADEAKLRGAQAVTLTFLRNPADNAGSFQGLLPQVSLANSTHQADGYLQLPLGPVQGMGADFDGDKVTLAARVVVDDLVFRNLRTGTNLLSSMKDTTVNILQRAFEEDEIAELGIGWRSDPTTPAHNNAVAAMDNLATELQQILRIPSDPLFAKELIADFIGEISVSNPKAKTRFLGALATRFPGEMQELADSTYTNVWLKLNSTVHRHLQTFQFSRSAANTSKATAHTVAPIKLESEVGTIRSRGGASFTQSLSFAAVGSDIFRKWQKLPYSKHNSPELDSGVEHPDTLQEMAALYAQLSSGKLESDMSALLTKDPITAKVVRQLLVFASQVEGKFGTKRASIGLLANMLVPGIQNKELATFGKPVTLLQWLLKEAVDAEEMRARSAGILDRDTAMQSKFARLRSANPGQAFVEVFEAFQLQDLLGIDADVFGANLTVGQWVGSYVNQSDQARRDDARALRMHATYLAKDRDTGRHNLPYTIEDIQRTGSEITTFQSTVDAMLLAGNTTLVWNEQTHRAGGRVGRTSNTASDQFRTVIEQMQLAAVQKKGFNVRSPEHWRTLLDQRPELGRAYMALIPDSAVNGTFTVANDGTVHIARWVYKMLSLPPKEAEMEYFRQTLIASWVAMGDHREYYKLTDRMHQLMYRLARDNRTMALERFEKQLFEAKDVDEFMHWVNTNVRGDEAPYTSWNRDVAEIDSTATLGGWQKVLEGATQREAVATLFAKTDKLVKEISDEQLRSVSEDLTFSRLKDAVANEAAGKADAESAPLLANLRAALDFARSIITPMGPAAMQRVNIGALLGLFGSAADKGKSATMFEVDGVYDAKGDTIKFGTIQEQLMASLTAYSTDEAGSDPSLLMTDDWDLMDDQGRPISWHSLTAESFVALWENPDNRPMLRAIAFPSAYEHTMEGRLDQVSQIDLSLTALVQGSELHDMLFAYTPQAKNTYLSYIESIAGNQAVQRYIAEVTISQLGSRHSTLQSPDEAQKYVQEAYQTLAEVLQDLAQLVQLNFEVDPGNGTPPSLVNVVDALRETLKADLKNRRQQARFGGAEQTEDMKLIMAMFQAEIDSALGANPTQADADLAAQKVQEIEDYLDSDPVRQRALAYGLPNPKGYTGDWETDTTDKRVRIVRYVLGNTDLAGMARWAPAIDKIYAGTDPADLSNLPELTPAEWVDVTRAIIASEVQLMASTTIPGIENARPGNPEQASWLRLHDPSFSYLIDGLLDSSNGMIEAAYELHKRFNRSDVEGLMQRDLTDKLMTTFFNPNRLGSWDDRIAEQITQAHSRIDGSGSPQGISQGGLGPQSETTEGIATRRTTLVPGDELRSEVTLTLAELQALGWNDFVSVARPAGPPLGMRLGLLDGRFTNEIVMTIDGQEFNGLAGRPQVGLPFNLIDDDGGYVSITGDRLRRNAENLAKQEGVDPSKVQITVRFLHPADQPVSTEAENWANNLFFEGVVMPEHTGDTFASLDAAWWFSAGGIDPSASAQALQAAKKARKALKQIDRISTATKKALEAGFATDFLGMLEAKAKVVLDTDLGGGERISRGYYNAIIKRLKMRHLVRGTDADGATVVLTAEQVLALQAAGSPLGITDPQLYVLSDSALRTMLGEAGTRGELRPLTAAPDPDVTMLTPWQGVINKTHVEQLPALETLGDGDLFKTRAAKRKFQRKISPLTGMDTPTRNAYQKARIVQQVLATEIGQARAQENNPQVFAKTVSNFTSHAKEAFSSELSIGSAVAGRNLPGGMDASLTKLVNTQIIENIGGRLGQQSDAMGWIYRHKLPTTGQRAAFGEKYGLSSLHNDPARKASWTAPGDPVAIDLDGFEDGQDAELKQVLRWFMDAGAIITLTTKTGSKFRSVASTYLREEGFKKIEGSDAVFERENPDDMPITVQARYDLLRETGGRPTYNRVAIFQTNHFGLEENAGFVMPSAMDRRVVGAVDLIPTGAFPNFGLPLPEHMAEVRQRLVDVALPKLIELSKMQAGRDLTKDEIKSLTAAIDKAGSLTDDGLYENGGKFEVGDIIPLYNASTRKLILYRHGHKPPANLGELQRQLKDSNTAIYGPETLPMATTHSGDIVRFDRANRYGLRVLLSIPLQAFGDKTVLEGNGFKIVGMPPAPGLVLPEGMKGWPISYVIGLKDSIGKENYAGRVDNFREAFASLGIDFAPDVAKFFFGPAATEQQINLVPAILSEIQTQLRRNMGELSTAEADRLIKSENLAGVYQDALRNVGFPSMFSNVADTWVEELAQSQTAEARLVRGMVMYLMAEDAKVEHILRSGGLTSEGNKRHGLYTREMPRLFTQLFDRDAMDGNLRLHVIEMLNDRFNNDQAPYGYVIAPNFKVTVVNANPEHTMEGYLQFAEAQTSGDNPVINLMAQDRKDTQTASAQQTSMAALGANARTATTGKLDKTDAKLRKQGISTPTSGLELLQVFRAVPTEEFVPGQYTKTPAELEYDRSAAILVESFRQPIDLSDWEQEDKTAYLNARNTLIRSYGLSEAQGELVDYWIRQHLYRPVDKTPEEEGGNPGRISLRAATEVIEHMEENRQHGLLPVADAFVPLQHAYDLALLHKAAEAGGVFQLRRNLDTPGNVTAWQDWVDVALAIGSVENEHFDLLALTATDGMFHTYRSAGLGLAGLSSSLYKQRADQLLDPETQKLMMSISPDKAAALHDVQIVAARATLEGIFGGTRVGLAWQGKAPAATAVGQVTRRRRMWHKQNKIAEGASTDTRDLLQNGIRLRTEVSTMNGFLRTALNLRAAMALINPMLTIGAPIEQFIQTSLEDITNLITGNAISSKLPFATSLTRDEVDQMHLLYDALGHDQRFRSMVFSEFALDEGMHNAGWAERQSYKLAKLGGMMQDPYYKMRGNSIARRYVESAARALNDLGSATNIDPMMLQRQLATDPAWLQHNHPAIHQMAMNTLREMKNMKDTTLSVAWKGFLDPMTSSTRLGVSTASTLMLKLPFMFSTYTINKVTQLTGMQGFDAAFALLLHGKKKNPILTRMQAAISGRPATKGDEFYDMSSVIESVDLTNAFVKSGVTHSTMMAMGLLLGNLGLSGEDEEDRRRRRAAKYKGFSYLYDPRDIVNDFRNADALYLDWLPAELSQFWRVADPADPSGERSMVHMNWLMQQVFSPIIGMERFFNTGNPWEIWWGFENAFYSFPLMNTMLLDDGKDVFAELATAAQDAESKGTPESMPQSFSLWTKSVMNLERMLLENSFLNMLYQAADKYDRDAWVLPERDAANKIVTNRLGVPQPSQALEEYVDPKTGQVTSQYKGRDWNDATLHGYTENRATLALIANIFTGFQGGYFRTDMAVKTRKIAKETVTIDDAMAVMKSLHKGVLKPDSPSLEGFYVPLDMREDLKNRFFKETIADGKDRGLNDYKAKQRAWKIWNGDSTKGTPGFKDSVYSKSISYKQSDKYYQLNTTYVIGPDGKPWATGIDRHAFQNLAGIAPFQSYYAPENVNESGRPNTLGIDGRLNATDQVRGLNTGMRSLEKVDDSFEIKPPETAAAYTPSTYTPSTFTPFKRGGGGGGGGGGGSPFRLQSDENHIAYGNDIRGVNPNSTIIRRATIRRERVDSEKGRLKPWQ